MTDTRSYNALKTRAEKAGYTLDHVSGGYWTIGRPNGCTVSCDAAIVDDHDLGEGPSHCWPSKFAAYAAICKALGPVSTGRPMRIGARGRGATPVQVYLDDADLGLVDGALVGGEKRTDFIREACRALAAARTKKEG